MPLVHPLAMPLSSDESVSTIILCMCQSDHEIKILQYIKYLYNIMLQQIISILKQNVSGDSVKHDCYHGLQKMDCSALWLYLWLTGQDYPQFKRQHHF